MTNILLMTSQLKDKKIKKIWKNNDNFTINMNNKLKIKYLS
jgi:hypothetical protein